MRIRWTITAGIVLVALLAGFGVPAFAEEEPASALSRLTVEERTRLEAKVPGWSELPAERQERIAENYIRWRNLPPEERARLERRIERLDGARRAGRGPSPHGRRRGPPDEHHRRRLQQRFLLMRAVGSALWADLPAETRSAIAETVGEDGRRAVEMAFYRRLWDHVARQRAATGTLTFTLPEDTPAPVRREVEQYRERAAAGDEKARQRLAYMAIGHEAHAFLKDLEASATQDPAVLTRVAAVLTERHPEAFAKARAELAKAATDREALARYARRGHPPGGHDARRRPGGSGSGSDSPEDRARALLRALEFARPYLERHPQLRKHAEELKRELRRALGDRAGGPGRGPGGRRRHPGGPGPGPGPGERGPGRQGPPLPPEGPGDPEEK